MIVYSKTKAEFVADVDANRIGDEILASFERTLHRRPSPSEIESWGNSMQFMARRVDLPDLPDDAGVAIEFTVPLTNRRVDFILTGITDDGRDVAVIVELKQWSEVAVTKLDAIVRTALGRRLVDVAHPSYQAWTYAALIEHYNETVRDERIELRACAYLHNLRSPHVINDPRYADHVARAPSFIASDAERFSNFLKRYVRHGDRNRVMYRIEHGRLRPSKSLADVLRELLDGQPEFVLVDEQKLAFETALGLADEAEANKRVLIVRGGPGTGKSVVAINLLVALTERKKVVQYVSRNAAPRAVYAEMLRGHRRKSEIDALFRGSGAFVDVSSGFFDVLVVDEAHRLNEKSGFYGNQGEHQVKELINASKLSVFFLDEDQRVTLRDVGTGGAIREWAAELGAHVDELELPSQFRCNGSDGYLAFLDDALGIRKTANPDIRAEDFDFRVFDDPVELWERIRRLNASRNKARMVAGYCWNWQSKRDARAMDIVIPEHGFEAQWNLTEDGSLWIMADESVEQIGCIHTCQGLELDYVGVIIGPDLIVRDGQLTTDGHARARQDQSIKGFKGWFRKDPQAAAAEVDRIIRNTYRTLMTRGQKGCYIFCTDPETNAYFRSRILEEVMALPPQLSLRHPFQTISEAEVRPFENALPLYDMKVAAGAFGSERLSDDCEWVAIPEFVRPSPDLFIAQVIGESMNRRIPSGAWCLFRRNPGGTRNGKIVVARHRTIMDVDTGESFTVKRYGSEKLLDDDGNLVSTRIVLSPESNAAGYRPIVLEPEADEEIEVVAEFVSVLPD